jgi:hypothetical protein
MVSNTSDLVFADHTPYESRDRINDRISGEASNGQNRRKTKNEHCANADAKRNATDFHSWSYGFVCSIKAFLSSVIHRFSPPLA